jgi:signal peptidase II
MRFCVLTILWALIVVAADQGTKLWAVGLVLEQGSVAITPFFSIVLAFNTGVTFGFLADGRWVGAPLIGLALVIIAYLSWLWWRCSRLIDGMILMSVIGGAFGNIIDRLRFGAVVDFLDVYYRHYHWPAFNLADSAIVVGIALYIWRTWRCRGDQQE